MAQRLYFLEPSLPERLFNRLFGIMIGLGLGLDHNYVLEVRGRKSGRVYSAPIDLLELNSRRYLVAPRGETNWVLNARAAGRVLLRKRGYREQFSIREVAAEQRQALLKAYLDRFAPTVQRYFPVPSGSPASAFAPIAQRYPVFELVPAAEAPATSQSPTE